MRTSIGVAFTLIGTLLVGAPATAGQASPPKAAPGQMLRVAPPHERPSVPLYAGAAPGSEHSQAIERWTHTSEGQLVVRNVTRPTITPFLPRRGKSTGAAVIVLPGGAHHALWIDNEGWQAASWLADHGIAAFVLKYRVNETPDDEARFISAQMANMRANRLDGRNWALADAQQALRLVRDNAAQWKVDPSRIGMMGFSAGAITTLDTALANDASARPAFVACIYGPMVSVTVPPGAPPLFAALALDDNLFGRQGFGIVDSWQKARIPVEVHGYQKGGHGFGGLGRANTSTTLLLPELVAWLGGLNMLGAQPEKSMR